METETVGDGWLRNSWHGEQKWIRQRQKGGHKERDQTHTSIDSDRQSLLLAHRVKVRPEPLGSPQTSVLSVNQTSCSFCWREFQKHGPLPPDPHCHTGCKDYDHQKHQTSYDNSGYYRCDKHLQYAGCLGKINVLN